MDGVSKEECKQCPLYNSIDSEIHPLRKDVHALTSSYKKIKLEMQALEGKLSQLYVLSVVGVALGCIKIYMEIGQ